MLCSHIFNLKTFYKTSSSSFTAENIKTVSRYDFKSKTKTYTVPMITC